MSLRDLGIPIALTTSKDDLVENFFIPLLSNSIYYDRGVGFFSSSWLRETFTGMQEFAINGGKARWITSPILAKADWDAIQLGDKAKNVEILKIAIINQINRFAEKTNENTLITLAWMIADGIIEFKLAKPRNKLSSEFHAKIGIFTDDKGNSISFDGSYNDSENGLHNYESIKVFQSWDHTSEYVTLEKQLFKDLWNNDDPNIEVFDIPSAIKNEIIQLRKNSKRPYIKPKWIISDQLNNDSELINDFPIKPAEIELRPYQLEAIDNWKGNDYKGILEMATGTGKTITALVATTKLIENSPRLIIIILCPYIHLAQQWMEETLKFHFFPILVAESEKKWIESVYMLARDFQAKQVNIGMIISTNTSFLKSKLQEILSEYGLWDKTLIIADEVHHCGTEEMLKKMPKEAPYRLGLSATPIRSYDEEGSDNLLNYFGDIVFKYGLSDAISSGYLTRYFYNPIPVHMKENEFNEYISLSKKLNRLHPNPNNTLSDLALMIAVKRARVLNNSITKIEWINENILHEAKFAHTLFYVGDKIFDEVLRIIGFNKRIIVHEFTHRQSRIERVDLLKKFSQGIIQAFISMKCLDEGVDVPPTRLAYFLASSSVSREFVQRRGRILRNFPGKQTAEIIDLISVPPEDFLIKGKNSPDYEIVRSALRREYNRITEFASLAENRHQSLNKFVKIADRFGFLDI